MRVLCHQLEGGKRGRKDTMKGSPVKLGASLFHSTETGTLRFEGLACVSVVPDCYVKAAQKHSGVISKGILHEKDSVISQCLDEHFYPNEYRLQAAPVGSYHTAVSFLLCVELLLTCSVRSSHSCKLLPFTAQHFLCMNSSSNK